MDNEVVLLRLSRLEKCLTKLRKIAEFSKEDFVKRDDLQDRAERNLQVAVQCCIDIGNHIIAAKNLGLPTTYKDVFSQLVANELLDRALGEQMELITGFRNILVHDYLDINYEIVYENLQDLDVFVKFAEEVRKLL